MGQLHSHQLLHYVGPEIHSVDFRSSLLSLRIQANFRFAGFVRVFMVDKDHCDGVRSARIARIDEERLSNDAVKIWSSETHVAHGTHNGLFKLSDGHHWINSCINQHLYDTKCH